MLDQIQAVLNAGPPRSLLTRRIAHMVAATAAIGDALEAIRRDPPHAIPSDLRLAGELRSHRYTPVG